MKLSRPWFLGLGMLLGATSGFSETIFDDFNDGEDRSPMWTHIDPAAQAPPPGAGVISFGSQNVEYRLQGAAIVSMRGDFVMTDGIARVELKQWNPVVSGGSSVGLLVRFQPQTLSGYFMSIDFDGSPSMNLLRLDNGAPSASADGRTLNYNQANTYILEAECTGDTIVGRVYEKVGELISLFDEVTLTDGTYGSGPTGLLVAQDSFPESFIPGDATFDNFFATDGVVVQPELVDASIVDGSISFRVVGEPGREYTVEYRPDGAADAWTTLKTLPPLPLATPHVVVESASQPRRIYRVTTPED